jgi:excinuclease UvrABC helicase subunit UvrB
MDLRKYHKQYAVGVESTVMDYTLNINRALKKKLKATQRNRTLQYKYTGVYDIYVDPLRNSFSLLQIEILTV